jgi:hypothetical protein
MHDLVSLNVWSRVKAISDRSQTRTAAIAYVTTDSMIQFGAGDVLVADASDNAVACGETSATILKAAIDRGAEIYSCEGLHAKLIVFDGIVVLGSANLSERSERDLVEAAWITDDPTLVDEARSFVKRLAAQSQRIDGGLLRRILSIKVARRLPRLSKRDPRLSLQEGEPDQGAAAPPPAVGDVVYYFNNCGGRDHVALFGEGAFYDLALRGRQSTQATGLCLGQQCVVARGGDHNQISFTWYSFLRETVLQDDKGEPQRVLFGNCLTSETWPKTTAARDARYAVFFDRNGNFKRHSVLHRTVPREGAVRH